MFITKIAGADVAQYAVRVDLTTANILEQIAKEANFKSVNRLIESILFEIALDERTKSPAPKFDKPKSSGAQHAHP